MTMSCIPELSCTLPTIIILVFSNNYSHITLFTNHRVSLSTLQNFKYQTFLLRHFHWAHKTYFTGKSIESLASTVVNATGMARIYKIFKMLHEILRNQSQEWFFSLPGGLVRGCWCSVGYCAGYYWEQRRYQESFKHLQAQWEHLMISSKSHVKSEVCH